MAAKTKKAIARRYFKIPKLTVNKDANFISTIKDVHNVAITDKFVWNKDIPLKSQIKYIGAKTTINGKDWYLTFFANDLVFNLDADNKEYPFTVAILLTSEKYSGERIYKPTRIDETSETWITHDMKVSAYINLLLENGLVECPRPKNAVSEVKQEQQRMLNSALDNL